MEIKDSPGNPNASQAEKSAITTPGTDKILDEETRQKFKALSDSLGITQIREDLDASKEIDKIILNKIDEITQVINKQSQVLGATQQTAPGVPAVPNQMDQIEQFGAIAEKLGEVWKTFKGGEQQTAIISQDLVNEKMKNAFLNDLETGESIRNFITDALKKKATKQVVNESLRSIGTSHEPG